MSDLKVTEHRGLPGRKSGEIVVRVAQGEHATFPLRVDVTAGRWFVVVGDTTYGCTDKATLERHVRDLMIAQRTVKWTRYLVIDYEAETPGSFTHRKRFGTGWAARDGDHEVGGLRLDWKVIDISDPIQHPGQSKPRRKERQVYGDPCDEDADEERYGQEGWMHDDALPDGAVLHTPARAALLVEVRRALGRLDAKLAEVLTGDASKLGAQLDRAVLSAGIAGLLSSGDS